jgi:hypothetical protein
MLLVGDLIERCLDMSAFRVLHLSDIHIGGTYIGSEEIAYKIVGDLENNRLCQIKSVIVTGDIFDGQVAVTDNLIKEAVNFFNRVLEEINIIQSGCKLKKSDFIFVPGNHDIVRVDDVKERWKKYNDFLVGFYNNIPSYYNTENYTVVKEYFDERIVFIGFNSCHIEKKCIFDDKIIKSINKIDDQKMSENGIIKKNLIKLIKEANINEYDDYGEIPMSQISEVKRKIKKFDGYNVVALFHHHFYLFPEVLQKYGDSSLVKNYANLIQQLKHMNVKTVLHGHKHFDLERPLITEDYYETTDSIINIFAGGSVGTNRIDKHTFSIIDFYNEKDDIKLIQNKLIYNNESISIERKQIPPKNITDRVIKLHKILENVNYDVSREYIEMAGKMNKTYKNCNEIIKWVSKAITNFKDVYKFLDNDYRNILFLFYAINYRTLTYKNIMGENLQNLESYSNILEKFFNSHLKCSEFDINIDKYHKIFEIKKLDKIKDKCDNLLNYTSSKIAKQYLAFSMIGIFFTDLYLVLTEYADDFYKDTIKYKVNISLDENKFHQDVPAPSIKIKSDSDKRSVYISLLCNEATAHKIAVLFVKEFDLILNKFEDYFKLINLKIYFILPNVEKNNVNDTIDNYNFEAYIPKLLPLLTGDNIYPSKEVFARELIQNSIDAIAVREAKDEFDFLKTIYIEIGRDENRRLFFKIKDYGTGMDRFKIERYFTSIGRSFYSGEEYEELNINYNPISNFGIGFLSSFMVCREIDVKTKSYVQGSEGLRLHIPNYDGCFFIEHEDNAEIGTEIKLYLSNDVDITKIINYIDVVMKDIKYDIHIKYDDKYGEETKIISSNNIRKTKNDSNSHLFIPFNESGNVLNIDWENEVNTNQYIEKYEYGILIELSNKFIEEKKLVLNSGILAKESDLFKVFEVDMRKDPFKFSESGHNNIIVNFPANWVQIDVSREKITSFSNIIKSKYEKGMLQNKIAISLHDQLLNYLQYCKNNTVNSPVLSIKELIDFIKLFCNEKELCNDLKKIQYDMFVKFTSDAIEYIVDHDYNKSKDTIYIHEDDFLNKLTKYNRDNRDKFIGLLDNSRIRDILIEFIEITSDLILTHGFLENYYNIEDYKEKATLFKVTTENILMLFTLSSITSINNGSKLKIDISSEYEIISDIIMAHIIASDVENSKNKVCITFDHIEDLFL